MSETTPKPRYVAEDHTVYDISAGAWEAVALAMGPAMAERIAAALNADEGKAALLEQNAKMRQALETILGYADQYHYHLEQTGAPPEFSHELLVDIPDLCVRALVGEIDPATVVHLENDGEDFPF